MAAAKFLAAVMATALAAIPVTLRYLVKHKDLGKAPKAEDLISKKTEV
ncbi:MAG: hypothetical protein KC422_08960 [Trueperaceae bacterium]|nr:hypothetical protein [Trueperaceae bacterium]